MRSSWKDRVEYGKDEQPYLQSIQYVLIVMWCVIYFTCKARRSLGLDDSEPPIYWLCKCSFLNKREYYHLFLFTGLLTFIVSGGLKILFNWERNIINILYNLYVPNFNFWIKYYILKQLNFEFWILWPCSFTYRATCDMRHATDRRSQVVVRFAVA